MTDTEYWYLVSQLNTKKIPADIYDTILSGDEFTEKQEERIIPIIREDMKNNKECF